MAHYAGSGRSFGFNRLKNKEESKHRNRSVPDAGEQHKQTFFMTILEHFAGFFASIGEATHRGAKAVKHVLYRIYRFIFKKQERVIVWKFRKFRIRMAYIFRRTGRLISYPFVKTYQGVQVIRSTLQRTKGKSFGFRILEVFQSIGLGLYRNRSIFKTFLDYAFPVVAVFAFAYVVEYAGSLTYAVSVSYNSVAVGYVENEAVLENARQIVQGRIVYLNDAEFVNIKPDYTLELIENDQVLDAYQLADEIISTSSTDMLQAEGLYIDEQFFGAVTDSGEIQTLLEEILESYRTGEEEEEVSFVNDIQVVSGVYLTHNIISIDSIAELLNQYESDDIYYTVVDGDTVEDIAQKNDISLEYLQELNPTLKLTEASTEMEAGLQVLVAEKQLALPVQIVRNETYQETVAYKSETVEDNTQPTTYTKVEQDGEDGVNELTARVIYLNGKEIDREILTLKVVKEPVDEKIIQGTAETVSSTASEDGSTGTGEVPDLIWPISQHRITSPFGTRYSGATGHTGLDMQYPGGGSISYGKPIMACADGVVIAAGWGGSYGNIVKIDHGDGVQTWYAHNSSLNVKKGDVVKQGDTVSYMGSTGNSTGVHLHLEVRINGIAKNPVTYLP